MRNRCRTGIGYQPGRSKRLCLMRIAVLLVMVFASLQSVAARTLYDQVGKRLQDRIEEAGIPLDITVQGEFIYASSTLPLFYRRRAFQPAWIDPNGLLPQADDLVKSIGNADREGLRPEDYHLVKIESTMKKIRNKQGGERRFNLNWLVDLDLLLTDAFLIYGSHLLAGRVNPETIDPEWNARLREEDLAKILQAALDSNRIEQTLEGFLPQQLGYKGMRAALEQYRSIEAEGGWPVLPGYPEMLKVQPNRHSRKLDRRPVITRGGFIKTLRKRLVMTGDLDAEHENNENVYDDVLEQAVRRFQGRHGLEVDGIVGPETLAAMNVPVEERIRQIELNMERCRWLLQHFGERYILINIANYELDAVENDRSVLNMRVVVGKPCRRTPIFSEKITYLVLNPYWNVPDTIAREDILPAVRKDPGFFARKNIKILRGMGKGTEELDPKTVDWSTFNPVRAGYRFRQDPGSGNPLGRVKFMFPNKYSVYIHDTLARNLFGKNERTFSSGCIRIENPIDLAEFVLQNNRKWTRQEIIAAIEKGEEHIIRAPEPVPVHLIYMTSWMDKQGIIQFRNDIYERDGLVLEALRKSPPDSTINRKWCKNMDNTYN